MKVVDPQTPAIFAGYLFLALDSLALPQSAILLGSRRGADLIPAGTLEFRGYRVHPLSSRFGPLAEPKISAG